MVRWRPHLGGLQGAQSGMPVVDDSLEKSLKPRLADDEIVIENKDGTKTLRAATARHLMIHIYNTLKDGDRDLFTAQVLARLTRQDFIARGKDPHEAFDALKAMQDDVVAFFNAIPQGENSPNVMLMAQGSGVMRLRLRNIGRANLRFIGMDMAMEGADWKLRWFVPAKGRSAMPQQATSDPEPRDPLGE